MKPEGREQARHAGREGPRLISRAEIMAGSKNRVAALPGLAYVRPREAGMDLSGLARLLFLSAVWGGSFLFLRVAAPVLGPVALIEARVLSAALLLALVAALARQPLNLRAHWRPYLVLGTLNSALPFLLYAHAARTLSASLLSVLNATAPIWGAAVTAAWTRTALPARTVAGLGLGLAGAALLAGLDPTALSPGGGEAVLCVLAATLCYGIATNYAKRVAGVSPLNAAHGSMWAAALILAPALPFAPPEAVPGPGVVAAVAVLGLVCTALAYLVFFRLIEEIGAAPALTVTYLIPAFGILWGVLFLGEEATWRTLAGALTVLAGTALVTGFSPRRRGKGDGGRKE